LANSYRDKGSHKKAIELYKQRIKLGGWIEEIWQSNYCIGKCFKCMGNNAMAIHYWLEAFNSFPKRIENLYEIIKYYRIQGNNELAYTFYMLADYKRKKHSTWDYLFLQKDIYDYKLDYELSIIGYYCNRDQHNLTNVSMKVLASTSSDDKIVLSNYKFYTDELSNYAIPMDAITQTNLGEIGKQMNITDEFVSSTPSVCIHLGNLVVCVRYVNYRIDESGNYLNQENIKTKNIIARFDISSTPWKNIHEYEMTYDTTHDGRYVGPEDVRLFSIWKTTYEWILYNANRGIGPDGNKMCIEQGIVIPYISESYILKYDKEQEIEKNWVLFGNGSKCIYSWGPLVIGDIVSNTFKKTHEITNVPNFFKNVRGSTNGVRIGDEYWFICHTVSYEDRRYYYHIIIVLDANTFEVKNYTPLWTFEKEKVEYTLGFVYFPDKNNFLIGYSIRDSQTKYITISKQRFDEWMIHYTK
jgi:tetratricopeptide (TPR) repeat protein